MLAALGQRARLEIFRWLVRAGPRGGCVDEVKRQVALPGSTLSHHLDTLRRSGLVTSRREGRFIYYAVDWAAAGDLVRFLVKDCCAATLDGAKPSQRAVRPRKRGAKR